MTYWGRPGVGIVKFYLPTGRKDDGPWVQDVCWKGALGKEQSLREAPIRRVPRELEGTKARV